MISVFTLPLPPSSSDNMAVMAKNMFFCTHSLIKMSKNSKIFDELKSPYLLKEHIFVIIDIVLPYMLWSIFVKGNIAAQL